MINIMGQGRGSILILLLFAGVVLAVIVGVAWIQLSYPQRMVMQGHAPTLQPTSTEASASSSGATGSQSPYEDEQSRQERDIQRVSDLDTLDSALKLYFADVSNPRLLCADTKTIYASAKIAPPMGWRAGAHMGDLATDGTGWLPVDFAEISAGSPLDKLPVDPVNDPSKHLVYLFACDPNTLQYELEAKFESQKYATTIAPTDGGIDPSAYEVFGGATSLLGGGQLEYLIPKDFWGQ